LADVPVVAGDVVVVTVSSLSFCVDAVIRTA
jgi:hypothetical protein